MYTIIIIIITIISMIIIIIIIIMIGRSANNRNGRPPKPNKINIKCLNTETTHTEYEKLKQMAGDVFLIVVATSEIHPDERPWLQHYADDLCVISGSLVCRSGSLTLSLSLSLHLVLFRKHPLTIISWLCLRMHFRHRFHVYT